jgi:hypothetical protein
MFDELVQLPFAVTVSGAGPLAGKTERVHCGEDCALATCDSDRQTGRHIRRSARDVRLIAPLIRKLAMSVREIIWRGNT